MITKLLELFGSTRRRSERTSRLVCAYHAAASVGDIAKVKECISRGVSLNARGSNGWTALHRAAFNCHEDIVELLIENNVFVDEVDFLQETPLHLVCMWIKLITKASGWSAELLLRYKALAVRLVAAGCDIFATSKVSRLYSTRV